MTRLMKNSNIQWIGDIPQHWKLNKIGSLYSERSTKVSDKDYAPLSVTKKGILPQLETVAKTDNGDNRKLVKSNDFVINSRSDRRGSCGISNLDGSVSLINIVLKPYQNMNNLYYNFVFHTECFADEFYRWGNGIVDDLWSTRWSNMKNIYIPYPPLEEQQRIATYLDEKCTKIDDTIAKEKLLIEKLKQYKQSLITETVTKGLNKNVAFKNSGIDWIGDIPQHWRYCRIKYNSYLKGRIGWQGLKASEFIDEGAYLVTGTDFENGKVNWNKCYHISIERYNEAPEIHLKENDLLITKDGTIGKLAYINFLPNISSLNSHLLLIRPTSNLYINRFIYWIFSSNIFKVYTNISQNGTIMASLTQEQISNFSFYVPPLQEQEQIANYLDEKCNSIDNAITQRENLIDKLTEYKKSLIYECVTGKKEV